VKDQKNNQKAKGLLTFWFLPLPLFGTSGDEFVNIVYITKAVAKSRPIFRPKSSGLLSQGYFLYWDGAGPLPQSKYSNGSKYAKTVCHLFYSPGSFKQTYFFYSRE
jgi:hypothetical protein